MRPGSGPRKSPSPPVPSRFMRHAVAPALPIVLALILLPAIAFASPPDPSWIAGFYDGGDGDDVVNLIYETSAADSAAPSHIGPLPCMLEISLENIVHSAPGGPFTGGPRAPPVLCSPEFVHVFRSLPALHQELRLPSLPLRSPGSACSDIVDLPAFHAALEFSEGTPWPVPSSSSIPDSARTLRPRSPQHLRSVVTTTSGIGQLSRRGESAEQTVLATFTRVKRG
jgi:hypothetical protein